MSQETVAGTPADPTVRYVPLTLGGKTYQLIYDFDSIARAEEMTGMELLFGVNWTKIGAKRMRAMLVACMLKAHPDIKPSELTPHITHKNILKIQTALIDAWVASTPEQEEESEANPPQPEASEN
jgi:hypothetical protein